MEGQSMQIPQWSIMRPETAEEGMAGFSQFDLFIDKTKEKKEGHGVDGIRQTKRG